MKKVKFTTTLNEELIKELKIKAIQENKNVNEILEELIKKYLGGNEMKNLLNVEVKASEILEYVKDGNDCKIEINKDGDAYMLPAEAYGYEDTVLTQVIEACHYEEIENNAEFINWLKDAYENEELEATNGQIVTIEIK